jgi:hypothetical protein
MLILPLLQRTAFFTVGVGAALLFTSLAGNAESLRFCATEVPVSAADQDRILQVAAHLERAIAQASTPAALVARAGTRLQRFGVRYTHAGLSLAHNPQGAWAIRQLYFDCDERQARLFDQGLAGFLMGSDQPQRGFVSLLLLPQEAASALSAAALQPDTALALLQGRYTANAHPYDLERQNCNQWVLELMAEAWRDQSANPSPSRAAAQDWLRQHQYQTEPVRYGNPLWRWLAAFVPWLSFQGHPPQDSQRNELFTTLPPDLERLALTHWPAAQRLELCYTPEHAVLRRSGPPLPETCEPAQGDEVLRL